MEYTEDLSRLAPENLRGFYADWPANSHPTPEAHLEILRRSYRAWVALEGEKCVGFINAISDGIFYAFIPQIEILPEYQRKGIGKELMKRMLASLDRMYAVDLICDEDKAPFYDSLSFTRRVGMVRRNYQNQSPQLP